jgi:hypothetical protein
MKHNDVYTQLSEAGVKFTTKPTMGNGFHGTEFKFPTMKEARKAEKATGFEVKGSNRKGKYGLHFTLY